MVDLSSSSPTQPSRAGADADYPAPGGIIELRQAIADLYPGFSAENVVVTNGASEALSAIAFSFLDRDDLVVATPGAYPSFTHVAKRLGARLVHGENAIRGARLLLLNNPGVPFGTHADMSGAAAIAEELGARIVSDEVYLDLRPGAPAAPAATVSVTALSVGDISKPLGLPGLRIGWVASRDGSALGRISRSVQRLTGGPSLPAMRAAIEPIRDYHRIYAERDAFARTNGERLFNVLGDHGWSFRRPEGGWTFFATPPSRVDAAQLARLDAAGLFLVPGSAFGAIEGFRISLFASARDLARALDLVANSSPLDDDCLVVLAKAPLAGQSKTRLAAQLGDAAVQRLAAAFLDDTLEVARTTARNVLLAFTPGRAERLFRHRAPWATLRQQPEGDLGTRISDALGHACGIARRVVLIGTDTPHLPPKLIDEAFSALSRADVVLGPAEDGGFYLIGVRQVHPGLFGGVVWSTASVARDVHQNASRMGLRVEYLDTICDIDDAASLGRAAVSIAAGSLAPRTREVLGGLDLEVLA